MINSVEAGVLKIKGLPPFAPLTALSGTIPVILLLTRLALSHIRIFEIIDLDTYWTEDGICLVREEVGALESL